MEVKMKRKELAGYIEGTLVKNAHTEEEVRKCAALSKKYQLISMVTNPWYTKLLAQELKGSKVLVGGVSSFPWGAGTTDIKIAEAQKAIQDGAEEIDTVMNLNAFYSGDDQAVIDDIRELKAAIGNIPLKIIIEAAQLNEEPLIRHASELVVKGNADYVKTCTGFNGGSTADMIRIIKDTVGSDIRIKASGGIRSAETALMLIQLGADRLGVGFDNAISILDSLEE